MLRGRVISTTYEYDDQGRIARSYASPAWTTDDHDLMLALADYESSLCSGCGEPKVNAWHPVEEGWYDLVEFTCHACTKLHGPESGVYKIAQDTWPDRRPGQQRPPWPDVMPERAAPTPMPD